MLVAEAFTESEGARLCGELIAEGRRLHRGRRGERPARARLPRRLRRARRRCPEEISVVGFNDMPFAARFQPPLTTIHIPHYEIGKAAGELMLERLQDGETRPHARCASSRTSWSESRRPPRGHPNRALTSVLLDGLAGLPARIANDCSANDCRTLPARRRAEEGAALAESVKPRRSRRRARHDLRSRTRQAVRGRRARRRPRQLRGASPASSCRSWARAAAASRRSCG